MGKIFLIDESNTPVKSGANPMLDTATSMKEYINIKTRKLPGQRTVFNHVKHVKTKEVLVTGLVLHFSQDMSDSGLESIIDQRDIEQLHLYADTIIINRRLEFPQTNVTISCRHLIIEEDGQLITTPDPHPQPFAVGHHGMPREGGAAGLNAGDISLFCATVENKRPHGPAFILTGGHGQKGELGNAPERSRNESVPISWSKVKQTVIDNDPIIGNKDNWDWPSFSGIDTKNIYYAHIYAINYVWGPILNKDKRYLETSLGNKKLENQDNGADAIPSGTGGDGGDSGNFSYLDYELVGSSIEIELKGGAGAKTAEIAGGKKAKSSTAYHIELKAYHKDINYEGNKKRLNLKPSISVTKTLPSRDGLPAKGQDGSDGAVGNKSLKSKSKQSWLRPILLEAMLGYAKTHFRDGERNKAQWILDKYHLALDTIPASERAEMHMSSLIREVELYHTRLNQNLDFYGYPPGWLPRLSVISNLDVIVDSRRDLAQLIYFANMLLAQDDDNVLEAKNLEWAVNALKQGLKSAQNDIIAGFDALPGIQHELTVVESDVATQLAALRDLRQTILNEVAEKERAQALFTGSFEILAGICTLIPVGQPYVGKIGGGIMGQISKIDINADNPLKEGLNFASGLSGTLGDFVENNQDKIKADATSDLTKQINKGTKELNSFSKKIDATSAELKEAETAINARFPAQELAILHAQLSTLDGISNSSTRMLSPSQDYLNIITNLDALSDSLSNSKELTKAQRDSLSSKFASLKSDKAALVKKLKASEKTRSDREANVEAASKAIKGFTDGVSGIAGGIQSMMVEFDENDPKVVAMFEKIRESEYKGQFEAIEAQINKLNKKKIPLVEQLLWFEQRISQGTQRINNNLVQWSAISDQRVEVQQHSLLPSTRSILTRIQEESWAMLMRECYYLTKSYQYRFLKRIIPIEHGLKKFIEDIGEANPNALTAEESQAVFDNALKSQFIRLANDLLVDKQSGSGTISNSESAPRVELSNVDDNGRPILQRLNETGRVQFRLENLTLSKQGTDAWKFYRLKGIEFVDIELEDPNVTFDFGIRHSGESLVRATNGKRYFFTSLSSKNSLRPNDADSDRDNDDGLNFQVQSWNASYNGGERNTESKGLVNAKPSTENDQLLKKFLTNFGLWDKFVKNEKPYTDNYPGGSSVLTLVVYGDPKQPANYKITSLGLKVHYEVLR